MKSLSENYVEISLENVSMNNEEAGFAPLEDSRMISLFKNTEIRFNLTAESRGQYKLLVEARGTPSGFIRPRASFYINDIFVKHIYLTEKGWRMYPVNIRLAEGKNVIRLEYINDTERLKQAEDRNMFVRGLYLLKEED